MSTTRFPARVIKRVGAVGVLSLAALAFPPAAQAHHASVVVDCTKAVIKYENFHGTNSKVDYVVKSDDVVVVKGSHTFTGSSVKTIPLEIYGDHKVSVYTYWDTNGEKGSKYAEKYVSCAEKPAPAPAPSPSPSPAPAPSESAPASGSAPVVATAPTAPSSGVQGVQVTSPAVAPARATLATRNQCTSRTVNVRVRGRSMRRVTFAINGRVVRRVNVRSGRRAVRATLPRRSRGVQAVTVRVQFRNNRTQVLTARANRCAQAQVQPQFTG